MKRRQTKPLIAPSPEELAAYADGELDPAARVRVQDWLCDHPEAAGAVDATRRLQRAWRATTPDDPGEAAWGRVLGQIETRVAAERSRSKRVLGRIARIVLPLAGAAAVLFALTLHRPVTPPAVVQPEPIDVLPVASAEDIEIISMDDADRTALVVGKPPLWEPMVLVSPGDTSEIHVQPDTDGMRPTVTRPVDGLATTIIVAPLAATPADEK
jgi:hypothetical protein